MKTKKKPNSKEMKTKKMKRGFTFIGWAPSNWGFCYRSVYRTRKEAIAFLMKNFDEGKTWQRDGVKYFQVQKVKCTVI